MADLTRTISAWCLLLLVAFVIVNAPGNAVAQALPNPYRLVDGWATFGDGREVGAVGDTMADPDGEHVWAVIRCDAPGEEFGWECRDSGLDPVIKFDTNGHAVERFGAGLFIWPHGLDIDSEGNVWVTDAVRERHIPDGDERGHQVVKFSPEGEVLMVLGTPGESGSGPDHFTSPADVVVADNGDIFVADGHEPESNNRIVKYSSDGEYLMSWGATGYAPGQFRGVHAIAMDLQGRIFVADRWNNRIQIFDQNGEHLASWTQFGRPSGIAFDDHGRIYVADPESDNVQNPGWEMGIRIGDAATGWVEEFILYQWGDPHVIGGNGAEFVAVDSAGNLYGGEPRPRKLQKYIRVRP